MVTLDEFLHANRPTGKFTPGPFYTEEGDSLTFYTKNVESYAERIDNLLTVYKSIETDELVGCQVKGVRRMLELLGKFGVGYKADKVELGLLFLTYKAESENPEARRQYDSLGTKAAEFRAAVPTVDFRSRARREGVPV